MEPKQSRPAVEDAGWVLSRYREAKDIIDELGMLHAASPIPEDLLQRLDDFRVETYLDTCTTLGHDCGCNRAVTT